ncbi:hypothetical protein [Streptomyces sp. 6N106]|uniref:hypothetical protein n=1 Tax=Streptomyces sp. 6N106 TaxID=3457418 RepID=UPI003FD5CF2B
MSVTTAGVAAMDAVQTDAVNGNELPNAATLVLTLDNTAGLADVTATFVTEATVNGYAVEDVTVAIAMGQARAFGHFPVNVFGGVLKFNTSAALDAVAYA